jgi:hypothetical protein
MYSGTLIADLFVLVEGVRNSATSERIQRVDSRASRTESQANLCQCSREISEAEQFPQPLRLSPADRYLGLLFVVHAQLVRALEPGNDFADPIDVHQIGAMRPPKKIRV